MKTLYIIIIVIVCTIILAGIVTGIVFLCKKHEPYETFDPKKILSDEQIKLANDFKQDYAPGVENVNNDYIGTYEEQQLEQTNPAAEINKQLEASVDIMNTNTLQQANTQYDQYQQQVLKDNQLAQNMLRTLPGTRDEVTTKRIQQMKIYDFGSGEVPPEFTKLKETASNTGISINPDITIIGQDDIVYAPSVNDTKGFELSNMTEKNMSLINNM